jgi:hypothetical protein
MNIADLTAKAVAHYWQTRAAQRKKQESGEKTDQGLRSAVTGGAQMDKFMDLFTGIAIEAGIPVSCVFRKKAVELPGFFRPTKEWDLLIIRDRTLIAAIEAKSQVGPSFGNNFITGQKRQWEVRSTYGRLFVKDPTSKVPSHSWAIFSCWKIARHLTDPSPSRSPTSRFFPNSVEHPTRDDMNCSAASSSWNVTILLPHL